jgi:hypothetical protein
MAMYWRIAQVLYIAAAVALLQGLAPLYVVGAVLTAPGAITQRIVGKYPKSTSGVVATACCFIVLLAAAEFVRLQDDPLVPMLAPLPEWLRVVLLYGTLPLPFVVSVIMRRAARASPP